MRFHCKALFPLTEEAAVTELSRSAGAAIRGFPGIGFTDRESQLSQVMVYQITSAAGAAVGTTAKATVNIVTAGCKRRL